VPEIVLSVSGLVLLLVAAWAGDRSATVVSILSCLVLAACFALVLRRSARVLPGPTPSPSRPVPRRRLRRLRQADDLRRERRRAGRRAGVLRAARGDAGE
jgi:hypothetical protein